MKHLLVLFVLSVAFVSSASYAAPNRIIRGNEGAYGGDDVGLEFKALGEEAFREIWRQRTDLQALFDVEKAATVLENVLVLAVDDDLQLAVDGAIQQVVAVNYPDVNRILVSAPRWKKINDTRAKQALVLHEVLSIMGLETTGLYPISSKFYGKDPQMINLGSCYFAQIIQTPDPDDSSDFELKAKRSAEATMFYIYAHSSGALRALQKFAWALDIPSEVNVVALTYSQINSAPNACLFSEDLVDCIDMMRAPALVFHDKDGNDYPVTTRVKSFNMDAQDRVASMVFNLKAAAKLDRRGNLIFQELDFPMYSISCH